MQPVGGQSPPQRPPQPSQPPYPGPQYPNYQPPVPPKRKGAGKLVAIIVAIVLAAFVGVAALAVILHPSTGQTPPVHSATPVASFTFSPTVPAVGQAVSFDGTASHDPNGTIATYRWDFGDGTSGGGATTSHTFASAGTETVALTVTDDHGLTGSTSHTVTVAPPPAEVQILSSGMYVDSVGYAHVVGEVQWKGSYDIDLVELTATFKNASGQVVGVSSTFTSISILTPQQRSPFDVLQIDNVQYITSYSIQVGGFLQTGTVPYRSFSVEGSSMYTDSIGYVHVVGIVNNTGQSTAHGVEVVVTFRDAQGRVVATTSTFPSPTDLSPGGTGSFDAIQYAQDSWGPIVSYDIEVQTFP